MIIVSFFPSADQFTQRHFFLEFFGLKEKLMNNPAFYKQLDRASNLHIFCNFNHDLEFTFLLSASLLCNIR